MGREDCQEGWHKFFADNLWTPPCSVLDVGAGLGFSKTRIPNCTTHDLAPGLTVDLQVPLEKIPSRSFDFVTAFDVIEHVVEDVDFLTQLTRIAIRMVFITTPNYDVSKAANGCHCREYTPAEFFELIPSNMDILLYVGDGKGFGARGLNAHHRFTSHKEPHQAAAIYVET